MDERAYVSIKELIEAFKLEVIIAPDGYEDKKLYTADMIRPGLQLAGFFDHFDPERVQVFGRIEMKYLEKLSAPDRYKALEAYFQKKLPVVVITRNLPVL